MNKKDFLIGLAVGKAGGGGWELVYSTEKEVSTTSTTAAKLLTINTGPCNAGDFYFLKIYDKAGPRVDHYYGSSELLTGGANNTLTAVRNMRFYCAATADITTSASNTSNGVYYSSISAAADGTYNIEISSKYSSSYSHTIDGTFVIELYKIAYPGDENPYA